MDPLRNLLPPMTPQDAEQQVRVLFAELSRSNRRIFSEIRADLARLTGHSSDAKFQIVGAEEDLVAEARRQVAIRSESSYSI